MSLEYGFNDKMEAGKAAALARRNKGLSERKTKWAKAPPAEDTELNRAYADVAYLARELAEAKNQLAGASHEPIDPWGAEFDRLSGKAERQGLPSLPSLSSSHTPVASEETRGRTMTKEAYLKALKKLGLTPASKATSQALGLSVRQCQRLSSGDQEIPETVAKLLSMYLEHGLPESG